MFEQKKGLSQVFLTNEKIAEHISSLVPLESKKVVEVGAGTGSLTKFLAEKAKRVVAVEIDEEAIPLLQEKLKEFKNVEIVKGNALKTDYSAFDCVFGNLPYHLSSPLLFAIIEKDFKKAVLMLQQEFALRLIAEPGSRDWSRLSVMVQRVADVSIAGYVSRDNFTPVPKVDSAIVLLKKKGKAKQIKLNAGLVNHLFQHKNQSVKNALKHSRTAFGLGKKEMMEKIINIPLLDRRVFTLTLEEISTLSKEF